MTVTNNTMKIIRLTLGFLTMKTMISTVSVVSLSSPTSSSIMSRRLSSTKLQLSKGIDIHFHHHTDRNKAKTVHENINDPSDEYGNVDYDDDDAIYDLDNNKFRVLQQDTGTGGTNDDIICPVQVNDLATCITFELDSAAADLCQTCLLADLPTATRTGCAGQQDILCPLVFCPTCGPCMDETEIWLNCVVQSSGLPEFATCDLDCLQNGGSSTVFPSAPSFNSPTPFPNAAPPFNSPTPFPNSSREPTRFPTRPPSSFATPETSSSSDNGTGLIIGVAVGVVLVVGIIVAVIVYFCYCRKTISNASTNANTTSKPNKSTPVPNPIQPSSFGQHDPNHRYVEEEPSCIDCESIEPADYTETSGTTGSGGSPATTTILTVQEAEVIQIEPSSSPHNNSRSRSRNNDPSSLTTTTTTSSSTDPEITKGNQFRSVFQYNGEIVDEGPALYPPASSQSSRSDTKKTKAKKKKNRDKSKSKQHHDPNDVQRSTTTTSTSGNTASTGTITIETNSVDPNGNIVTRRMVFPNEAAARNAGYDV